MENTIYYPLNGAQQELMNLFSFYPDMTILNLAMRMDFVEEINEQTLFEAVRETEKRLPYLGIRFCEKDGETVQYVSDEIRDCEVVDLPDRTSPEQVNETLEAWTASAFRSPILDKPLCLFRLYRLADGRKGLYLCGHHFIMDGYALLYTADYLTRVYEALDTGKELPAPAPAPWKALADDIAYYSSERFQRDHQRNMQNFKTEPHFTSLNGLGSPEFIEGKRYGKSLGFDQLDGEVRSYPIPKSLAAKVEEAAKASRFQPGDYYLTALRTYLGHVSGTDDVTVLTSLSGRRSNYELSCGFALVGVSFMRTIIPETTSFTEAVHTTSNVQMGNFRHPKTLDRKDELTEAFGVSPDNTYISTMFAYLGVFDLEHRYLKLNVQFVGAGQSNEPLYMIVVPRSCNGDLSAAYMYSTGYTRRESIEKFHSFMLRFLELGLDNPDKSIGELVEKSL